MIFLIKKNHFTWLNGSSFLDCTSLLSTALPYSRLHFLTLDCTSLFSTALPISRLHLQALVCTSQLSTALPSPRLHFQVLDCTSKPSTALPSPQQKFPALDFLIVQNIYCRLQILILNWTLCFLLALKFRIFIRWRRYSKCITQIVIKSRYSCICFLMSLLK